MCLSSVDMSEDGVERGNRGGNEGTGKFYTIENGRENFHLMMITTRFPDAAMSRIFQTEFNRYCRSFVSNLEWIIIITGIFFAVD